MMAELKRKEDQLTTADLAGRSEAPKPAREIHEMPPPDRPKPVRGETDPKPMRSDADLKPVRDDLDLKARERTPTAASPGNTAETTPSPLFTEADVNDLRGRWSNVQTGFVDEPRHAVEEADKLVATVMQ